VTNGIDVIGDVHGQFDRLAALLKHLGYRESAGAWRHPGRRAVFLGDLIDRGPKQMATVDLVRRMVDAGTARCVMGNHELNAIAWATSAPGKPGRFLRDHHMPGTLAQHQGFLEEVDGRLHQEVVAWFKTLPLWLDLGELRIVHACWHQKSMDRLQPLLGPDQTLTDELLVLGSTRGHWANEALEIVCTGPDVRLLEDSAYPDNHGELPQEVRIRWWLPDVWQANLDSGPPVIFGHYWFVGTPAVISGRYACLDYSVAKGGPLVAYRWDGEAELATEKMAWV
jgi:hypothetical protein